MNHPERKRDLRERSRARRAGYRLHGLCTTCGRPREHRERQTCDACRNRYTGNSEIFFGQEAGGQKKKDRTDLGLALLSVFAVPGISYTLEEIAAWCGCTRENIRQIELDALAKLRRRLTAHGDPEIREAAHEFFATNAARG